MRPFYENFPFFVIFIALLTGILTTLVHKGGMAVRLNLIMLGVTGAMNATVLYFTARSNTAFTYAMGVYGSPIGNELRAGPVEALLATAFCAVMFLSVLGGRDDVFNDILPQKRGMYFIMLDLLLASLFALCYTNDVFTGYVFIEINTLSACAIVMAKDCGQTIVATIRYLIMSLVGSGMFLFGLALLYSITGELVMPALHDRVSTLFNTGLYYEPLAVVAGMVCVGLSVKSALFPFHTWLPDAHGSGTTTSSAILSGLVLKGYVILMIKMFCRVFELDQIRRLGVNNILFVLAVCAMIFGSVKALHENHCKKMIAYSSVAQMGYIYLGLGMAVTGGIAAAVFQILAHAFTKPLLFISAGGMIDASAHQKKLYYLRGAAHRNLPAGIGFTVGGLSMVGVPLLAGFITKSALAEAALGTVPAWQRVTALAALAISSVLNAMYYVPAIIQIWKSEAMPAAPDGTEFDTAHFRPGRAYTASVLCFTLCVVLLGCLYTPISRIILAGVRLL